VASNIVGKTGRAILQAIARGHTQPEDLAELALGRLQAKKTELTLALHGRYSDHFRWLLGRLLAELEWLDSKLAELDSHIAAQIEPHTELVRRLCSIPGVDRLTAWVLIAELGLEMSQFPDAKHAASWAGLCPGNAESAGKRFSGRTRKGDRYLRRILVQNAWAVAHMKDCFLTAVFYRLARNCGMKKAAVAVAHRILVIAYHIIRDGTEYREQGGDYFDRLHPERTAERLTRRLMHRL
jgi:transposase